MTTWIISWGDSRSVAHSRVPGGASGSSSRKCVRPPSDGEYLEVWFGIDVGAGAIEDIGRGEVDHEEAAISVHDDMALAADDFLACRRRLPAARRRGPTSPARIISRRVAPSIFKRPLRRAKDINWFEKPCDESLETPRSANPSLPCGGCCHISTFGKSRS